MTRHPDGSVTLTAAEFQACAGHCEMSPNKFAEFLQDNDGDLTVEDLTRRIFQMATLFNFEPDNPHSAN